jgi:outer membrane protein OmpA-like peptidoglycan-associated protein
VPGADPAAAAATSGGADTADRPAPAPTDEAPTGADDDARAAPGAPPAELPDQVVIPVGFDAGSARPEVVDPGALDHLARAMLAARDASFEVVGFAVEGEAPTPRAGLQLAQQRAAATLEVLRSRGPSRRRLAHRSARPGEPLPHGLAQGDDAPLRAVVLRVVR